MRASDQILEFLDGPKREDRYHRTALDDKRLGDVTTQQLQHYLACRRVMEEHLDEESVFDELVRLAAQADEETGDAFTRILTRVEDRVARIATGMLEDGWTEDQVRYAISTLGTA
jgi:hypothetical protein